MDDRLQRQRFERKYFITERQANEIREMVRGYMIPDNFSAARPDHRYEVYSLYIDSRDLATYWATVHCDGKRFKLRVRYYSDDSEAPVYFEIKRRENDCILKSRGAIRRSDGLALLSGEWPRAEHLFSQRADDLVAVQKFCHLMMRLSARPTVVVGYQREAWMGPGGNSARLTIDQEIRGEPRREVAFRTAMEDPVYPFGDRRVLELKFTDRFPDWFRELAQQFGLDQSAAPKYCASVASTGQDLADGQHPVGPLGALRDRGVAGRPGRSESLVRPYV